MNPGWAVIEFERGKHTQLISGLCRHGIACVVPMTSEFSLKGKREVFKPALKNVAFLPGLEQTIQAALDRVSLIEGVWRLGNGSLAIIPDAQMQTFLTGLERREKKPAKVKKTMNLGDMASTDAFTLYAHLFGVREAVKKFGRDLRGDAP